jgi:hypothetical protein
MIRYVVIGLLWLTCCPLVSAARTTETLQQFISCIETGIAERHDPATTAQLLLLFGTTTPTEPHWEHLNRMVETADDEATSFALSIPKMDDTTSYGIARRLILSKTKNAQFVRPLGLYPDLLEPDFMWKYQWLSLAALVRNEIRMLGNDVFLAESLDQITTSIKQTRNVSGTTAPLSMTILAAAKLAYSNRSLMSVVSGGDRIHSVDVTMNLVSMFPAGYLVDEVEVLQFFHKAPLTDFFSFELAHGKLINSPIVQEMVSDRIQIMSGCIPIDLRDANLFTYGIRIQDSFQRNDFMSRLRVGLEVREQQLDAWRKLVLSLTEDAK